MDALFDPTTAVLLRKWGAIRHNILQLHVHRVNLVDGPYGFSLRTYRINRDGVPYVWNTFYRPTLEKAFDELSFALSGDETLSDTQY